jgi:hypothetical protein
MATAAEFISVLHQARTQGHIWHNQTEVYSEHKALGHFYEGIVDHIDGLVESLEGYGPRIVGYTTRPLVDWKEGQSMEYLKGLCVYVQAERLGLGTESWIQNQIDDLQKFLYQIKFELTLNK